MRIVMDRQRLSSARRVGLAMAAALLMASCGDQSTVGPTDSGALALRVAWPDANRLLPAAAQSVVATVVIGGQTYYSQPKAIVRPQTSAVITGLPAGTGTLQANAYPNPDGTGVAQATASTNVTVVAGQQASVSLTLTTSIAQLEISPSPVPALNVGDSLALAARAVDSLGNEVLVATGAFSWSSSDPSVASVNASTGYLTALAAGQSSITVTEAESGLSSSATAVVQAASGTIDLAVARVGTPPAINGTVNTSEWSGVTEETITFRNEGGDRQRDYFIRFAHDGTWLYLGVRTPVAPRWDSYFALFLDGDNDDTWVGQRTEPHTDLLVGQPGPGAWGGYDYYNIPGPSGAVTPPTGTTKASNNVSGALHYEMKISLADLAAAAGQRLGLLMKSGEDGTAANSDWYPWYPGQAEIDNPATWAELVLSP